MALPLQPPVPVTHKSLRKLSRRALVQKAFKFETFSALHWEKLATPIKFQMTLVAEELIEQRARGFNITTRMLFSNRNFQEANAAFRTQLPRYLEKVAPEMRRLIVDAGQLGRAYGENLVKLYTTESFQRVARQDVARLVTRELVGSGLERGLEQEVYARAWSGLSREMVVNLRKGLPPESVSKYATRRGLSNGLNHIKLVARDQALRAYRQADLETFRTSNQVGQIQRVASHDGQVCELCLSLDGKVYDVREEPELHPQDRCDFIPIMIGAEPYKWLSGEEWLRDQPLSKQQEILGPGKYKLFRQGHSLSEFSEISTHPVWGPTVKAVPLNRI